MKLFLIVMLGLMTSSLMAEPSVETEEDLKREHSFWLDLASDYQDFSNHAKENGIPSHIKNDKQLFLKLAAEYEDSSYLKYASNELKNDREFVLKLVTNASFFGAQAIEYASDELKNDKQIIFEAIKSSNGNTFNYASDELKNDREFVRQLVNMPYDISFAIMYASDELKNDRELALSAIRNTPSLFDLSIYPKDHKFHNDREFMQLACEYNYDQKYTDKAICHELVKKPKNSCLASLDKEQLEVLTSISEIMLREYDSEEFKDFAVIKSCLDIEKNGHVFEGTLNKIDLDASKYRDGWRRDYYNSAVRN